MTPESIERGRLRLAMTILCTSPLTQPELYVPVVSHIHRLVQGDIDTPVNVLVHSLIDAYAHCNDAYPTLTKSKSVQLLNLGDEFGKHHVVILSEIQRVHTSDGPSDFVSLTVQRVDGHGQLLEASTLFHVDRQIKVSLPRTASPDALGDGGVMRTRDARAPLYRFPSDGTTAALHVLANAVMFELFADELFRPAVNLLSALVAKADGTLDSVALDAEFGAAVTRYVAGVEVLSGLHGEEARSNYLTNDLDFDGYSVFAHHAYNALHAVGIVTRLLPEDGSFTRTLDRTPRSIECLWPERVYSFIGVYPTSESPLVKNPLVLYTETAKHLGYPTNNEVIQIRFMVDDGATRADGLYGELSDALLWYYTDTPGSLLKAYNAADRLYGND